MTPPLLSVRNLNKTYQKKFRALCDINLEVEQGEFIALLGPSGCGKTTSLSTLAGFLMPDSGTIHIDGKDVTSTAPHKRALNTVFQNYALFPHMTVLENVSYGPLRAGVKKAEAHARASGALEMVGLGQLISRYPAELSGGQKQRVALARAIVNRPRLLLLDEPLSALDMKLRKHMQRELKDLQRQLGISFIFVTHDQEEAMAMADRIVVMNHGAIEQVGPGGDIYRKPATRFVADFIGDANLLECHWAGNELRLRCGDVLLRRDDGRDINRAFLAVIRPEDVEIIPPGGPTQATDIPARVIDIVGIGSHTTFYLDLDGTALEARRLGTHTLGLQKGDTAALRIAAERTHLVEASK